MTLRQLLSLAAFLALIVSCKQQSTTPVDLAPVADPLEDAELRRHQRAAEQAKRHEQILEEEQRRLDERAAESRERRRIAREEAEKEEERVRQLAEERSREQQRLAQGMQTSPTAFRRPDH